MGWSSVLKGYLLLALHWFWQLVLFGRNWSIGQRTRIRIEFSVGFLVGVPECLWLRILVIRKREIVAAVVYAHNDYLSLCSACIAQQLSTCRLPCRTYSTLVLVSWTNVSFQDVRLWVDDVRWIRNVRGVFLVPQSGRLRRLLTSEPGFSDLR